MTFQSRDEAFATAPRKPRRHDIAVLDPTRLSRRFVIFTPSGRTIADVAALGARHIGTVAAPHIVERVITHNPDNLWAIARRSRFDAAHPVAEGFYAFLMLNADGLKCLGEGTFDGAHPDLARLAAQNERPAAIYAWAVCAPRGGADPYVLIRPEGRWHRPGVLERSAERRPPPRMMPRFTHARSSSWKTRSCRRPHRHASRKRCSKQRAAAPRSAGSKRPPATEG